MKDGPDSSKINNPSSPLFVNLIVNNTEVKTMIDTGSARSIIRGQIIGKLSHRPHIEYQRNTHRTANNGRLVTSGLVKLTIQLNQLSTTIIAEVSNDLCTDLVLGNDWLRKNEVDIITTGRCIRKKQGSEMVNIPFLDDDQEDYSVHSLSRIEILPGEQTIIPVRIRMKNANTAVFTPSREFIEQTELILPHALVKVASGTSWIAMINTSETPRILNNDVIIGTVSMPSSGSLSFPTIVDESIEESKLDDLQCRICREDHRSKKDLFEHLRLSGHYLTKLEDGSMEQFDPKIYQEINQMIDHLSDNHHKKQLHSILIKYGSIFDNRSASTIRTSVKHTIEVANTRPIVQRPYRRTAEQEKLIDEMCEEFHRNKIIRPSQSPWASPVVLQKKKDGSWRFCIDYRRLNEVTKKDNYPLPRIQEIFDALANAKYFSKLDFHSGYHQVPIDEMDRSKTAFDQIKKLLINRPLLHFPESDRTFIIQVDASDYGIGAVLMQSDDQGDIPVAYMSQKLNHQQRNWNTTEKECFAVVSSIKKWHHYVFGRDFIVKTDHHALCWLNRNRNSNPKLNRWRMLLQDYSLD